MPNSMRPDRVEMHPRLLAPQDLKASGCLEFSPAEGDIEVRTYPFKERDLKNITRMSPNLEDPDMRRLQNLQHRTGTSIGRRGYANYIQETFTTHVEGRRVRDTYSS